MTVGDVARGRRAGDARAPGRRRARCARSSRGATSTTSRSCRSAGAAASPAAPRWCRRRAIALSLERLRTVRSFAPELWRMEAEAGVTTATIARLARENGVYFPPDPGAPEQSQLGGMIATNAGGPHAFKYGVTGDWVTGIEAVLAPGRARARRRAGAQGRRRLRPARAARRLGGNAGDRHRGVAALRAGAGGASARSSPPIRTRRRAARPCCACWAAASCPRRSSSSTRRTMRAAAAAFPLAGTWDGFLVIAEADGSAAEAARVRDELREALAPGASALATPAAAADARAVWRWREGVSLAVTAVRGAKLSEDIAVPVDRLGRGGRRDDRDRRAPRVGGLLAGATPATATSTRRSCSSQATAASARAPTRPRSSSSRSRASSAAR